MSDHDLTMDRLTMDGLVLGKQTEYVSEYAPELLFPIARSHSRHELGLNEQALPFRGVDIWTAYEISWLNAKGRPEVAVGEFTVPYNSPNIIESKSFKLYLNSFNQSVFQSFADVAATIEKDLSAIAGAPVMVTLKHLPHAAQLGIGHLTGESLDQRDIEFSDYHPDPDLLKFDITRGVVTETLYSDLLKSNCPVTGQPDWASIYISYRGDAICKDSLLRYIVSFRQHQDFHEQCVERMFVDIKLRCRPEQLTVYARYTRRGGLDINPFRSDSGELPVDVRLVRQ